MIVSNVGTATGTVKLFTTDATTGRTTGTVYETSRRPTRAGSWVTLSTNEVTLAPGAHKEVAFTVHVPAGTPPGEWVGGIVAETFHHVSSSQSSQKANVQIKVRDLTIVAVQSNVPGPRVTHFAIGKVAIGGRRGFQQIFLHIASKGNVLVKPTGRVSIYGPNNKLLQLLPFTMDTFLPRTAIDYPLLLKRGLGPGSYRAVVTLQVAGGPTVTATRAFSVSQADVKHVFSSASPTQPPVAAPGSSTWSKPWLLIPAGLAVVLVLLALVWRIPRRR